MGFGLVAATSLYVDFKDKIIVMAKQLNSCDEGSIGNYHVAI